MQDRHISVIFVVDDEPLISKSLAMILQQQGFAASYFTDPMQALERALATPPDLLISDVVMPNLSGVELAIAVGHAHANCKVLLFSGQAATADLLQTARGRGHNFHLLPKPIHPEDLLREIGRLEQQFLS